MANQYLKGNCNYHLVKEGETKTLCGFDFTGTGKENMLEATKDKPDWQTCKACAAGGLPDEVLSKMKAGQR
jgi:hypothetical protein